MPDVTINGPDGSFSAYLAKPAAGSGPGLLVIQEIFGVNADMRAHCDRFAGEGYIALCPDLFWRQEPGIQITDQTDAEWQKAFQLYQGFDPDKGVVDLQASLAYLRGVDGCSGKVGSIGFCLGGFLVYLMATRSDTDANVAYYGVGIDGKLDEAGNISKPTLLHIAEEDEFVTKDAQKQIIDHFRGNPLVTTHSYPGVGHAFARNGGIHYDAASAELANQRTSEFLSANLR
jgi:carboxymethylenebutenolidase